MSIELETQILKLKGLAGLLEAGTECEDKLTNQKEVFAFLSVELLEIAESLENIEN